MLNKVKGILLGLSLSCASPALAQYTTQRLYPIGSTDGSIDLLATNITTPFIFAPNTLIQSSQVNSNFSTIASVVNGNLDNSNIAAGANIASSKLNLTTTYLLLVTSGSTLGWGVGQTGDTQPRIGKYGDGSLRWGPGGSTVPDIGIQRTATNKIQLYVPGGGTPLLDLNGATITNGTGFQATTISTLTLTNQLTVANGGTGLTSITANGLIVGNGTSAPTVLAVGTQGQSVVSNGSSPAYAYPSQFGDSTNLRPAPTTGTLTGTYYTSGNWTTTGAITCNACRLYFGGTVTINNAITVGTGNENNAGGNVNPSANSGGCTNGQGPGGGIQWNGPVNTANTGGGGGSHGGAGGAAKSSTSAYTMSAAPTYPLNGALAGSGGGAGSFVTTGGGAGGAGGDGFYIESVGNVTIGANISANGAAGAASGAGASDGGGGGGSGGTIDIRSQGNITINSGITVSANGGAGGAGGGAAGCVGGGGGGGGVINMQAAGTYTNSGNALSVSGGAGGSGTVAGNAGSTGLTSTGSAVAVTARKNGL